MSVLRLSARHIRQCRSYQSRTYSLNQISRGAIRCISSESTSDPSPRELKTLEEIEEFLSKPTWSVKSLLPPEEPSESNVISSKQLHHLLRLSALPAPETPEEEAKMLKALAAQLHFVGKMHSVDATGINPLRAIRDERIEAEKEQTITLETLKDALEQEDVVGKHHKRIRRKDKKIDSKDVEDWNIMGSAEKKVGRYFVVESETS